MDIDARTAATWKSLFAAEVEPPFASQSIVLQKHCLAKVFLLSDDARRETRASQVWTHDTSMDQTPETHIADLLRQAGLRPTRQRMALGELLFGSGDRHVTAELLHAEAESGGENVSLATVYNTLHQFRRAGLLRELAIDGSKTYFDTNTSNHNHYFLEPDGELMDIPSDSIRVDGLPEPPEGMKISHIDVVVRLVKA